MRQTRSCNPAGCSNESRCVSDASCSAVSSCTVTLSPIAPSTYVGTPVNFTASVIVGSGTVDRVDFGSTNTSVSVVSPASDATNPYNTSASALSAGTSVITADVVMGGVITCTAPSQVLTVNANSCDITAYDVPLNGTGDTALSAPITVNNISPAIYSIDQVLFTVNAPPVAGVAANPLYPNPDDSAAFQVEMEALSLGSTTYTATATLNDPGATQCIDTADITVTNPSSWWQVKEGDAVTDGGISSAIPPTAYESALIVHDVDEFPGVPTYQGSLNPSPPNVSSKNWNTNSSYSAPIPDYAFFEGRVPASSFTPIITNPVNTTVLTTGTLDANGYLWLRYDGADYGFTDLVIEDPSGTVNLGTNKVVLFVKDADLVVNSKINLTPGRGFFMAIVERDISVNQLVGDTPVASPTPDLEGIYIADGNFATGSTFAAIPDDIQLHIRGSVVGNTGVDLERVLSDNSLYPGELFEYGVDQILAYPQDLTPSRLIWREVAP